MTELTGNEILARCLKAQGVRDIFFIMGGPMLDAELCSIKEGIRLIDTRHEQGAAYMAQGYSRVTQGPGVCMAASGPATLNFGTGLANALIDGCPVVALVDAIRAARQPVIVSGSGVLWSHAWDEMKAFVEKAGIPFYTTPQGRGVIPDDHPFSYLTMRNDAFRQADLIIILGTRTNYVIGHAAPPRFSADAKIARIEIDPEELGTSARNIDIPIVGDCKSVLQQLCEAVDARTAERFQGWRQKLADGEARKRTRAGGNYPTDGDIHPLRLCEEIKNFMQREAILSVDGQEILNFGRQSIPTFVPGHRLNSGPFGTMGVGLPFAVGAKAAKPDAQVICLHGDGSFGQNAMELDTAVRHKLPLLCVISLNGGWTADPERNKPGRDLGYTRYDKMAEALGCYAEYVEEPEDIRPALQRAWSKVEEGMVGFVNVKTDYRARATTVRFSSRET